MDIGYIYGLICSIIGAHEDYKKREVSDYLWVSMIWAGLLLHFNIIEFLGVVLVSISLKYNKLFYVGLVLFLISFLLFKSYFAVSFLIFYVVIILLYYLNFMGGGDCKFLLGLSYLKGVIFTFIIFLNAIIFIIPLPILFFIINIKNKSYKGLKFKNFILLFISLKKDREKIKNFETIIGDDEKIFLIPKINTNDGKEMEITYSEKVWITPQIPFLVFIMLSYILYMIYPFPVIFGIIKMFFN